MSDAPATSAPLGSECPQCGSAETRPSRSSYPQDNEKIAGARASFWRCAHCGARFLGPASSAGRKVKSAHGSGHSPRVEGDRRVMLMRAFRNWIFPLLVILTTIAAVVYFLDKRDPPQEQIILPDQ